MSRTLDRKRGLFVHRKREREREREREERNYSKETKRACPESRFTSTPAGNSIPPLLFPDSGGCYRPPHRCAPMNFNSCPSDPGEKEHRKYIFFLFPNGWLEIKRAKADVVENESVSPDDADCSRSSARSSNLSCTTRTPATIKIRIRTSADIQCKFHASHFIGPCFYWHGWKSEEANWKFVSLVKARTDRSNLVSPIFLFQLAIARGNMTGIWRGRRRILNEITKQLSKF